MKYMGLYVNIKIVTTKINNNNNGIWNGFGVTIVHNWYQHKLVHSINVNYSELLWHWIIITIISVLYNHRDMIECYRIQKKCN